MNDECWSGNHALFTLTTVVPSLILWSIGLPLLCYYRLRIAGMKGRRRGITKAVYGFMYAGYSDKHYGWELFIFARKFLILVCLVFLNQVSIKVQALVALWIVITAILLQIVKKPYFKIRFNQIEELSLVSGGLTIYAGILYLSGDIGVEA